MSAFQQILFGGTTGAEVQISMLGEIGIICVSVILGLIIAVTYMKTFTRIAYSQGMVITIAIIPAVISTIIYLVGNNVATALSIAGAFSIVRFRSPLADPKDLAYVFISVGIGLACGVGLWVYAVAFAVILAVVLLLLSVAHFGNIKGNVKTLKIALPEDMNFESVFEEIFEKYTREHTPIKTRTADLGSVYEVSYNIIMKKGVSEKDFIDELRCINSNLNIILTTFVPENTKKMY
jgi:uncharacterized membrane protein YhiD involved in acid resistance